MNEVKEAAPEKRAEVDIEKAVFDAKRLEQSRIEEILTLGRQANIEQLADRAISEGKSIDEFRKVVVNHLVKSSNQKLEERAIPITDSTASVGLSDDEIKQFSFVRALNALANPRDKKAQEAAGYEIEVSRFAANKMNREVRGIFVPNDILKRDLVVGTATAGGHTVQTDLMAQDFITLLRAASIAMGRGVTLSGLVGNVAIPRQTGGATAYWVAESGAPTESQQAFDQVTLSPKTVGAFTDYSRRLLMQSSIDVEAFVRQDLALTLATEIDAKAIAGDGTGNTPTGIINQTGVNTVPIVDAGMIPTWAEAVAFETAVATDNALVSSMLHITTPAIKGALKTALKSTGIAGYIWENDMINGYDAVATTQCPATNFIMANMRDLIVGLWGGLDLMADPYTGSTSGTVRIVALQDCDIAVRHPESFAIGT